MFSRLSEEDLATTAVTTTSQQRSGARSSAMPSIIGADIVIEGMITTSGDVQLDGRLDGNISGAGVAIGSSGRIYGDIVADDVIVRGHIKGRIRARRVLLCSSCHVEGDIRHEALMIEAGAFFEGTCFHPANLLADDPKYTGELKPTLVRTTSRPGARIARQYKEAMLKAPIPPFSGADEACSTVRFRTFSKYLFLLLLSAGLVFAIPNDGLRVSVGEKTAVSLNWIMAGYVSLSAAPSNFEKKVQTNFGQLIGRGDSIIRATLRLFEVSANRIEALVPKKDAGRKILAESQPITPKTRTIGVKQLASGGREKMGDPRGLSIDPYDPRYQVGTDTAFARLQYQKYGSPPMLAAINSGAGKLDDDIKKNPTFPAKTPANVNGTADVPNARTQRSTQSLTRLVEFTRPDGSPVWIDVAMVKSVRETFPGEYASGVQSVVSWGKSKQGVRESTAAAAALIRDHGGKL